MTIMLDRPTSRIPEIDDDLTRRRFLGSGAAVTGALLIGGCADDESEPPAAAEPTPTQGPLKVAHKYGETEVPLSPERVVSLGFVDHDALLALGVVPVGIGGDQASDLQRSAVWPWAHDQLGDARPEVLSYSEIDVEKIAALNPDLITGFTSGMTQAEYEQLSQVAPTVAQIAGFPDYFAPWQEVTKAAGRTLNKTAEAEALIDGVEQAFAAAREEHPEFEGVQAAYGGVLTDGFYTENSRSSRVAILTELGFDIPREIDDLAGEDASYSEISAEQLDLLDRDVLVWELGSPEAREAVEDNPVYATLEVAEENRDVFVDEEELVAAMAYISVLSLPTAIELLVPKLAEVLADTDASASPSP